MTSILLSSQKPQRELPSVKLQIQHRLVHQLISSPSISHSKILTSHVRKSGARENAALRGSASTWYFHLRRYRIWKSRVWSQQTIRARICLRVFPRMGEHPNRSKHRKLPVCTRPCHDQSERQG